MQGHFLDPSEEGFDVVVSLGVISLMGDMKDGFKACLNKSLNKTIVMVNVEGETLIPDKILFTPYAITTRRILKQPVYITGWISFRIAELRDVHTYHSILGQMSLLIKHT